MVITKINIFLQNNDRSIRAFADIVFDNCFIIKGLKVINSDKGFYVGMPYTRTKNNRNIYTVHPTNKKTRFMIENAILDKYEQEINK